jgi:hypothetical protein
MMYAASFGVELTIDNVSARQRQIQPGAIVVCASALSLTLRLPVAAEDHPAEAPSASKLSWETSA